MCIRSCVCECVGCADGSWEADTVQENRPLATDLFGRWQFQGNSITMAVASLHLHRFIIRRPATTCHAGKEGSFEFGSRNAESRSGAGGEAADLAAMQLTF